jgi:hypothetical protein
VIAVWWKTTSSTIVARKASRPALRRAAAEGDASGGALGGAADVVRSIPMLWSSQTGRHNESKRAGELFRRRVFQS